MTIDEIKIHIRNYSAGSSPNILALCDSHDAQAKEIDEMQAEIKKINRLREIQRGNLAKEIAELNETCVDNLNQLLTVLETHGLGHPLGDQVRLTDVLGTLVAERDRLKAEVETERMRLAACGVIANANTETSAKSSREMLPEYWSGSAADVAGAVDREMELRTEVARLKADKDVVCGQLEDSRAEVEQLRAGWDAAHIRLQKERDEWKESSNNVSTNFIKANEINAALGTKITQLARERDALEENLKKSQSANSYMMKANEKLIKELNELREDRKPH